MDVELVNEQGEVLGAMEKLAAHAAPGHLHRAFSVFLLDGRGRFLLQRRAAAKYHFGGLWSNSCCGHPAPGADLVAEAVARTREELGVLVELTVSGQFVYRAEDPGSGLVEHELDTVLVGRLDVALDPNPAEVSETRLLSRSALLEELARTPDAFTPWLGPALEQVKDEPGAQSAARSRAL